MTTLKATATVLALLLAACGTTPPRAPSAPPSLATELDSIFDADPFTRALVGVRVESLDTGQVLYQRNADKLVMPASNMKIVTLAAAAERLGWDFTFETRLEAAGAIVGDTLAGDLVVTGSGDPSIAPLDFIPANLFDRWAQAVRDLGVRVVAGRLVADDNAFDDQGFGPGWSWDYLDANYAAPSGALSYNQNVAVVQIRPGRESGDSPEIQIRPPGHGFEVASTLVTGEPGSPTSVAMSRAPGSMRLDVSGRAAAGGPAIVRTISVENPTTFFAGALREALIAHGITVRDGAWDIDEVSDPPATDGRRLIATRRSPPLSELADYFMTVSQNFYAEMLLKAVGRQAFGDGSVDQGRRAVRETMAAWGVPAEAIVQADGSGLSRYNYVTAAAIVHILTHVWKDDRLRDPFVASLPIAGQDRNLETRMRGTPLAGRVAAKTGTIANVRALSGFLETETGGRIVFAVIVNHFTAPAAEIDLAVDKALARLVRF